MWTWTEYARKAPPYSIMDKDLDSHELDFYLLTLRAWIRLSMGYSGTGYFTKGGLNVNWVTAMSIVRDPQRLHMRLPPLPLPTHPP